MPSGRCPRCLQGLAERPLKRTVPLRVCPEGHGALLPKGGARELSVSAAAALEEALTKAGPAAIACPSCGGATRVVHVERHGDLVELDACRACGSIWFDAGEMDRVQRPPPRPAAQTTSPPGVARLTEGGEGAWVFAEGVGPLLELVFSSLDW